MVQFREYAWILLIAVLSSILVTILMFFVEQYDAWMRGYLKEMLQNNVSEILSFRLKTMWIYFVASVVAMILFSKSGLFAWADRGKRPIWVAGAVTLYMVTIFVVVPSYDDSSGMSAWVSDFLYFNGVLNFFPFMLVTVFSCMVIERLSVSA